MSLENRDDSGNSGLGKVLRLWACLLSVEAGEKGRGVWLRRQKDAWIRKGEMKEKIMGKWEHRWTARNTWVSGQHKCIWQWYLHMWSQILPATPCSVEVFDMTGQGVTKTGHQIMRSDLRRDTEICQELPLGKSPRPNKETLQTLKGHTLPTLLISPEGRRGTGPKIHEFSVILSTLTRQCTGGKHSSNNLIYILPKNRADQNQKTNKKTAKTKQN